MTPSRTARLVLVTRDGTLVGSLPPLPVATPWWQDIEPVVRAAREHCGVDVVVLRLLATELGQMPGGLVTYLAEVAAPVAPELLSSAPWDGELDKQPLRLAYAHPGGPAADLAWAEDMLARHGMRLIAPPTQIRTWNLSSLWRLPVQGQNVWLKVVPPMFAHEGELLARLAGARVPVLLAHDRGRCLLAEIPGSDLYTADFAQLITMVTLLVDLQSDWSRNLEILWDAGLPDWRGSALVPGISEVVRRTAAEMTAEELRLLDGFVADLPQRFAALAACSLPDTLVHGDFHPGNCRGEGQAITLLDWGDSGIGHPLLDQSAFFERVPEGQLAAVREHWVRAWQSKIPDADPLRAGELLAPIAAARRAMIYRGFLDQIEPAEQVYHRVDPADWLRVTVVLLREEAKAGRAAPSGKPR